MDFFVFFVIIYTLSFLVFMRENEFSCEKVAAVKAIQNDYLHSRSYCFALIGLYTPFSRN